MIQNIFKVILSFLFISVSIQTFAQNRVDQIISKMTLEQKIEFIGGTESFYIRSYDSLGIPKIKMADGPVGVRANGPSVAYTATIALASTWDVDLAKRIGTSIGMEARSKNIHNMLCPGMNIYRAPMCGRNFEYLGEDPFLAGEIASSFIVGMQSQNVIATAKHYIGNFQEYNRHLVSTDMDERTMREIYLPAFETCVKKGNVATIMTSYNLINGIHAAEHNYLINKILKEEWGFKGFVMSDWTSTYNGVASAKAGLDLEMPSGSYMNKDTLIPAIKDGRLKETVIDDKIRRILNVYERFGYLDNANIAKDFVVDTNYLINNALEGARKGTVLLQNKNNYLPINKNKIKSVAILGPNAHPAVTGGGGSAYVTPTNPISLYDAIKSELGSNIDIVYQSELYKHQDLSDDKFLGKGFYSYINGKKVDGFILEHYEHKQPDNNPKYVKLVSCVEPTPIDTMPLPHKRRLSYDKFIGFLQVDKSDYYCVSVKANERFELLVDGKIKLATIKTNSVKQNLLILKLEKNKEYKFELKSEKRQAKSTMMLGYSIVPEYKSLLEKTVANAFKNDVVFISIGYNPKLETEELDRPFELPAEQEYLLQEVIKHKKPFAVIINAGGNVDMSKWVNNASAILHAWYPGGYGNIAVAEILFGKTNPSGKLPVSFEKRWQDNASYNSYYPNDGHLKVKLTEGIFIGYRHYDKKNIAPMFPFGHGLSYTKFEYKNLKVNKNKFKSTDTIEVEVTVKNIGKMDGSEVVQLYVSDLKSALPRPVKELKSFSRVDLKVGESKKVKMLLTEESFRYFDSNKMQWVVEPGAFDVLVGASSRDIKLKKTITAVN